MVENVKKPIIEWSPEESDDFIKDIKKDELEKENKRNSKEASKVERKLLEISASMDPNPFPSYVDKLGNVEYVTSIHIDVFDGKFVERVAMTNLADYMNVINRAKVYKKPVHVHLTIADPHKQFRLYLDKGLASMAIQFEAFKGANPTKTLKDIKKVCKCGLSINPDTPVRAIKKYLKICDGIIVFSGSNGSGYSGQKFTPDVLPKIAEIKSINPKIIVTVDGGINDYNIDSVEEAGADVAVEGTNIYNKINKISTSM